MPAATETRHVHRFGPVLYVTRCCHGCGEPMGYKMAVCTGCPDFALLIPAEPPRTCRA